MRGLSKRIAIVTGATGLLGSAVTCRLVSEGATVVVVSRQLKKAQSWIEKYANMYFNQLIPLEIDLADERSITSAFKWLTAHVGIPTILIANASLRKGLTQPLEQLSHDNFNRLFEVDVTGHFLCARYLVDQLTQKMNASIVFLSSVYALVGVNHAIYPTGMPPTPVQYVAVKSGILGITKYLAAMWGARGIRVNAIISGGIRSTDRQSDEFVESYARRTMLGRMAMPEEIASAVVFLVSEEASYVTGECLVVDGGFSAW